MREPALFNVAIDSKLRSGELVRLRARDVCQRCRAAGPAFVMLRKPGDWSSSKSPSRRGSLTAWIRQAELGADDYLFASRLRTSPHISTRQYARIVRYWVQGIGLSPTAYGTHAMRRTQAALIARKTRNLRVVQFLLGHRKPERTVRYLGIESTTLSRSQARPRCHVPAGRSAAATIGR